MPALSWPPGVHETLDTQEPIFSYYVTVVTQKITIIIIIIHVITKIFLIIKIFSKFNT